MPWRTTWPMDERVRFISECLTGEATMSLRCRRYGISRKTGYKLWARYQAAGPAGLTARSRARHHQARAVSAATEAAVVKARAKYPRWGPRKLRVHLCQQHGPAGWPAASTIGELLRRHGLTRPRPRRPRAERAAAARPGGLTPNALWSADFKGWFRTGDGARCLPFTLMDHASRYLLRCQAVPAGDGATLRPLFEAAFREYGLPEALRTDNGPPFGSTALGGLSQLAVWWIKLGIRPERIAPGHPEQNGRHERLHLTLQQETAQPPAATGRAQQRRFDAFRQVFNAERPHAALDQRTPAAVYMPSSRPYPARVPEPEYPRAAWVRRVRGNGEIRWAGRLVFVSAALVGELVGLEEVHDDCWRLRFGPIVLGWVDARATHRGRPAPPKLLPMCPV